MGETQSVITAVRFVVEREFRVGPVEIPGIDDHSSDAGSVSADPEKYLPDGAGGMVVFGVKGGSAEGIKLVDNIKLFSILANVGDAKSLIIHPASTTHSQLSDEDQRKAGLTPELVRLSIGLEHIDDITGALDDALALI